MKILHIINNLNIGGAEKMLLDIVTEMNKINGHSVEVLLLSKNNPLLPNFIDNNIKVITLNFKSNFNPLIALKIIPIIKSYDVVHAHLFPVQYWVAIAGLFSPRCKLITTEHSTHNKRRENFLLKPIEKIMYSRFKAIIAISEGTKLNLLNWIGKNSNKKIMTITNGINASMYSKATRLSKPFFENETFNLLMVSRFSQQKDQDTIIRSLTYLPHEITLILAGDGERRGELEKLVKKLELKDRVKFLGVRNDIPNIMKSSDIVIVSSHWEGFGLVAIEGMASCRPVIASKVAGLSEVVGDNGLLFDVADESDLAKKVLFLYKDKNELNRLSKKGYSHSLNFTIERLVEQYIKTYERMLHS